MITVKNKAEAWDLFSKLFPKWTIGLDAESSERAGYDTYRDENEFYNYVCDLGDHLEINIKEGNQTERIYIEAQPSDIIDTGLYLSGEQLKYIVNTVKDSLSDAVADSLDKDEILTDKVKMLYDILEKIAKIHHYVM